MAGHQGDLALLNDPSAQALLQSTIPARMKALVTNSAAALTIDENAWPPKVLLVRGSASVQLLDDVSPEYAAADLHGLLACRSVRAPPAT